MSRRQQIDPRWQSRLAADNTDVLRAFERTPLLPGQWTELGKPNLGRRRRWRWLAADGNTVYVKCYHRPALREQLDRIWRQGPLHSRAWWEFSVAQRLADASVRAPRTVGCAERMRGAWESSSVVLLESAAGDAFDRVWSAGRRDVAWFTLGQARHELTRSLARFIAAFHGTGFCHRDLYLCHVFVELDPAASRPPQFSIIDLARAHRPVWRRMRWLIKDLGQLDSSARAIGATRTDRLRFLLAYLGLERCSTRVGWYVRRIVRRSDHTLARDARKAANA